MAADRGMRGLPRGDHRLDQRPLLVAHVGLVGLALAHGAQPNMPTAADRPGCRTATRSGDDKTPMHSHTALSMVAPFKDAFDADLLAFARR